MVVPCHLVNMLFHRPSAEYHRYVVSYVAKESGAVFTKHYFLHNLQMAERANCFFQPSLIFVGKAKSLTLKVLHSGGIRPYSQTLDYIS